MLSLHPGLVAATVLCLQPDVAAGVVHAPKRNPDADDDRQFMPEHVRHSVRRSAEGASSADEDSDFD